MSAVARSNPSPVDSSVHGSDAASRPEVKWWLPKEDRNSPSIAPAASEPEGSLAFGAVVVFTGILLLSPQNWIPALAPFRIAFLSAGAAALFLLWGRWKRKEPLLRLTWEVAVALALPLWAFLTVPLSYWPGGSVSILTDLYIKAILIFWLLSNIVTTVYRLRFIATTLTLCTLPLAVTALRNFVNQKFVAGSHSAMGRIVGYQGALAENANDLALMLNLLLPLAFAIFLSARNPLLRVLCVIVIALDVMAVILTLSRAGFLGLVTLGLVYFVKLVRRPGPERRWAFGLLILAVMALPFLPAAYVNRVATITDVDADPTGSSRARWHDAVAATRFVLTHPMIGAGLGMDTLALNDVPGRPQWTRVHNVYLQHAVDLGLPGLCLFLVLFYGVFRAAGWSHRRLALEPELRSLFVLAEALQVSLIVFAVSSLFFPVAYHFYFYYIAGLVLATRRATEALLVRRSDFPSSSSSPPVTA